MTTQEAYERIRAYFTAPGARLAKDDQPDPEAPTDYRYRSWYRMDDGRACAVGCLIPDEYYSPDLEGRGAYRVAENLRAVFYGVSPEFLSQAQRAHDSGDTTTTEQFVERLDEIALRYGLRVVGGEA